MPVVQDIRTAVLIYLNNYEL